MWFLFRGIGQTSDETSIVLIVERDANVFRLNAKKYVFVFNLSEEEIIELDPQHPTLSGAGTDFYVRLLSGTVHDFFDHHVVTDTVDVVVVVVAHLPSAFSQPLFMFH